MQFSLFVKMEMETILLRAGNNWDCLFWLQKPATTVLPNLRDILENPPSLSVSLGSDVLDTMKVEASVDESNNATGDMDVAADMIDWDITVDSSQIDWDIGLVEETEDVGNGLGPYEMVNASEIFPNSSPNEGVESDMTLTNKDVDGLVPDVSIPEISWDIGVEHPQADLIKDAGFSNTVPEYHTSIRDIATEKKGSPQQKSQLLETEYRNKVLDDLFEVCPCILLQKSRIGILVITFWVHIISFTCLLINISKLVDVS